MNFSLSWELPRRAWERTALHLQNPTFLRVAVLALIGIIGLGGVGVPICWRNLSLREELAQEAQRQRLIKQHKTIFSHLMQYRKRIPEDGSTDWWIGYLADTIRTCQVKLTEFKPVPVKSAQAKAGQLAGGVFKFTVTGSFKNILTLIGTLENRQCLARVTQVSITKGRDASTLIASFSVGVLLAQPKPGKRAERKDPESRQKSPPEKGGEEK